MSWQIDYDRGRAVKWKRRATFATAIKFRGEQIPPQNKKKTVVDKFSRKKILFSETFSLYNAKFVVEISLF